MLGGNSERTKRIGIRGGLFNIFAKNEYELDPNFAHISLVKGDNQEPIGYSQSVQYLAGYIEDIQLQRRTRKMGDATRTNDYIDIHLDSGGTKIIIELNFDSGPGKSFATTFRNLIPYLNQIVCINVYQMKPADGQEHGRQGVLLYANTVTPILQKGAHIPSFYVSGKAVMDNNLIEGTHYFRIPSFEKQGRTGAMEYDKDAASNWLYQAFREEVYSVYNHYEMAEEQPSSSFSQPQSPPPPQENNFYANQPQQPQYQQPQYQPPQQQYQPPANTTTPPPPAAPYTAAQQRPNRTEPVQHEQQQPQPVYSNVTPATPPPPPTREYRQREPSNVQHPGTVQQAQPQGNGYNPQAGMGARQPVEDAFEPMPNDDLPF